MECDLHTGLHIPINRLVVEILGNDKPLAAGEDGEIVITDLHNYGMPFIRYKIGDVGKLLGVECPCGRKTPLLELTHGRITDIIVTPDGKYLPGMFFPHLFKEISSYVEQFQIIQARIDELLVKIVPNSSYGPRQTEYLRRKIEEKLGPTIKVSFELVKIIPPEKSGKHRVTISKLHTASTFDNNLTSLTKKG
jgi:phenylacetate-CoA ligase